MINAAAELREHIDDHNIKILCAVIIFSGKSPDEGFRLRRGYNPVEERRFFKELDWVYENHRESLFGRIWYTNGSWSERMVYGDAGDETECWEHYERPGIPPDL